MRYIQRLQYKRDLSIEQKRPIYRAKETYLYSKRDLSIEQKRPIYVRKTYKEAISAHTKRQTPCLNFFAPERGVCRFRPARSRSKEAYA